MTDTVTHAELETVLARLETRFTQIELRFEKTVHDQTWRMFQLLLPVYGGIIIGLLLFIAARVMA
jgi:hypothetical protein